MVTTIIETLRWMGDLSTLELSIVLTCIFTAAAVLVTVVEITALRLGAKLPRWSKQAMLYVVLALTAAYSGADLFACMVMVHHVGFAMGVALALVPILSWGVFTLVFGPTGAIVITIIIYLIRNWNG